MSHHRGRCRARQGSKALRRIAISCPTPAPRPLADGRDREETRPLRRHGRGYNLLQVIPTIRGPMNFNLYLDDKTASELDRTAKKLGETRSGLIRKAVREWLDKKTLGSPGWPSLILEWQGIPDMPPFESYRDELLPPRDDAFS